MEFAYPDIARGGTDPRNQYALRRCRISLAHLSPQEKLADFSSYGYPLPAGGGEGFGQPPNHIGSRTVSMTWITPFDCRTLAIVT
jgi:hypothetical protein